MKWNELGERVLKGRPLTYDEALAVMQSSDDDILAVLDAAFTIRRHYFGRGVSLHVIRNAKSGLCTENCSFCSQSAVSHSAIPEYPMQSVDQILAGASINRSPEP